MRIKLVRLCVTCFISLIIFSKIFYFLATKVEINCPVGTYNPNTGIGSHLDCTPCDAGSYCLEGISVPTGQCLPGYYCPSPIPNTFGSSPPAPPLIGSYGDKQVS